MLHLKGTLKVNWLSFWEFWAALLLLQGYKLWPNSTRKSVHKCILQTRPAIIARRIWMAEPHARLEKVWSAAVTTEEALLLHQLHPTSTAHCCSVSATLWDIPSVLSVEKTRSRFTSGPSEFFTVWSNEWAKFQSRRATAQPIFSFSYTAFTLPYVSLNASTFKEA